jgi:hypothetical protein
MEVEMNPPDFLCRLHIHVTPADRIGVETLECSTCETERGFLLEHYEWYGWMLTCLSCGDQWEDGERLERPFRRAWRKAAVAEALARLETALRAVQSA